MIPPYADFLAYPAEKEFFKPDLTSEEPCGCCKCWVARRTVHTRH